MDVFAKKSPLRLAAGLCSAIALPFFVGCSSLGVATSGASYFNSEITATIKAFNSAVQQYRAVKKSNDNALFDKTAAGNTYYIYDIRSNRFSYSDNAGSGATSYAYTLQSVSVYEDSKSSTETHTAYIHDARRHTYTDEKGNQISEADALAKEESYRAQGFESRRKDKGVSLIAYIKDGVVVKAEPAE